MEQIPAELYEATLRRLSRQERDLVDVLCVSMESMTRSDLVKVASPLDLLDMEGRRLSVKHAESMLSGLIERGLVVQSGGGYSVVATLRHCEVKRLESGRFAKFADAIRARFPLMERVTPERYKRNLWHAVLRADEAEFRRDLEQVQAKWGARPGLWLTKVLPFDPLANVRGNRCWSP